MNNDRVRNEAPRFSDGGGAARPPQTTIREVVREAARCPGCRSELSWGSSVSCNACSEDYAIVGDIPVLITRDSSLFDPDQLAKEAPVTLRGQRRWGDLAHRLLPNLSSNYAAEKNFSRMRNLLRTRGRAYVLVVGSGSEGSGIRKLIDTNIVIVNSDVAFGPSVALLADAHQIPFADSTFDGVVVQAVLEHVLDPAKVVAEVHRVLKSDGFVYAETPFMQQVHEREFDFTRFTLLGHRRLFRSFVEIDSGSGCGPGMALAWAWQYFLFSFARTARGRRLATVAGRATAFWLKYFDRVLLKNEAALDGASAVFFLGQKSAEDVDDAVLIGSYRGGMCR